MKAVASRNVKFISHSDQGGRGDGVQIMVHRGYAYIGHGYSNGISIIDVHDPKSPRPVNFLPCPPTPAPFISKLMMTCCSPSTGQACGRCRSMRRRTTRGRRPIS
jgi:hypothetical protein